jgi:putative tricarboxylic transport membrane protein
MMIRRFLGFALAGVMALSLVNGSAQSASKSKQWQPEREIEFVVPSAPGGGSDLNARTVADLAQKNKFSPHALMVVNKPGGSGAVSFSYVNTKKGDPYTLMVLHSGQVMGSYVNNWAVKAGDLTYVATLALDELTLCVRKDGPNQDFAGLLKAVKAKPESVKIGGSQRGNSDHLSFELINKYTRSKFSYVMFNSSGEVMSALLGGHIDAGIFNPMECIGQVEAGKVIPVAAFSKERLSGVFKEVPTFGELGYKQIQVTEIRAIAGPPQMPAASVKFYQEMLRQITETAEWKNNYIEKFLLTNYYLNASDTKKFHEKQIQLYTKTFREVGLMK